MKEMGSNPTTEGPLERALKSVKEGKDWTIRNPPADVRRMLERAIKEEGQNKNWWIMKCLRAGLSKYAKKKDGSQ